MPKQELRLDGFISFFEGTEVRPLKELQEQLTLVILRAAVQRYKGDVNLAIKKLGAQDPVALRKLYKESCEDRWLDLNAYTLGIDCKQTAAYGKPFPAQRGGLPQF